MAEWSENAPGGGRSEAPVSYREAGVDLDAAAHVKMRLKDFAASTCDVNTLSSVGSFGGLYALPPGLADPVLVSSTDGVGTKLKVAIQVERHDTVGRDLVNHCVNDILVQGARPLFFLDYLAVGEMDERIVGDVVSGVAAGCRENECVLLGGETAQMPEFYRPGEYDLAGFVVGAVERDRVLDGRAVRAGDRLIALGSAGLHTNGYTLARRIVFDRVGLSTGDPFPGSGRSVADELLAPHRSYLRPLAPLLDEGRVLALAHVTGGGIPGNLPRVLPDGLGAVVERGSWELPQVFAWLQEAGRVEQAEMDRVFNMGVGMIAVVTVAEADTVLRALRARGETAWHLGRVEVGAGVRYS